MGNGDGEKQLISDKTENIVLDFFGKKAGFENLDRKVILKWLQSPPEISKKYLDELEAKTGKLKPIKKQKFE